MSCKAQTLHLPLLSAPLCQQHSLFKKKKFFLVWQKLKLIFLIFFLALLQFPNAATVATAACQKAVMMKLCNDCATASSRKSMTKTTYEKSGA